MFIATKNWEQYPIMGYHTMNVLKSFKNTKNVWHNKFIMTINKAVSKSAYAVWSNYKIKKYKRRDMRYKYKMLTALSLGNRIIGEFYFFYLHSIFQNF